MVAIGTGKDNYTEFHTYFIIFKVAKIRNFKTIIKIKQPLVKIFLDFVKMKQPLVKIKQHNMLMVVEICVLKSNP
ncbi:MAG: hypothetical protein LBL74_06255 [Bacteroidales bacterium]|nr:hypothetical protein [Bacteroidales bacterium]